MKIRLVGYNKKWNKYFLDIRKKIEKNVNSDIIIEHIGSTSVPQIKVAKPIIDILIGVNGKLNNYIDSIKNLGFTYIKEYEIETPNRRFFYLEKSKDRLAHIHLVKINSKWFRRHIAFRDELRNNIYVRKRYEKLKIQLSKKKWENRNDYANAKTKFIRSIEAKILS